MSDIATLTRLVAELSGRLDALAARVPVRIGAPQVPSPNLVVEVIQSAHGFTLGQVVTNTGASWDLAVAGDDFIGVVCKVADADTVWVCEWGIVCIDGATFAEGSVYYLGASAGTPTTTPGTPKRAVFYAVSSTMILVTNPAKDASGGGGSGGLDPITGPAVLGKAGAGSGDPVAITATADDTILGRRSGSLTYAKIATAEIDDDAVTAAKLADTAVSPAAYGSATQIATFTVDQQGRITAAASVTATPAWGSITGVPSTFPPSGHTHTIAGDVSGTTAAAVVDKIKGKDLASAVGSVSGSSQPDLFLWWDKTNSAWSTYEMFPGSPVVGDLVVHDPSAADTNGKMSVVAAGTAYTLFGRATGTAGLPAGIAAAEATVMQRGVGGNLAFSTTIVLGKAGSGGSLGGWKVNASTSGTASEWENSGSTNSLTAKYNGTTVLDVKAGSTQQIVLKNTSGTAGTTIQIDWSGNSPRLQMFRPDISTTTPLLDINLATAPTGGWTTAKAVTLREIDVCDAGTAKKMLIMASAPF